MLVALSHMCMSISANDSMNKLWNLKLVHQCKVEDLIGYFIHRNLNWFMKIMEYKITYVIEEVGI